LHGNSTWSFLYRGIIIRLNKRFRCIAIDYPGFGLSEAPDDYGYTPADQAGVVRELVQHFGLQHFTIMERRNGRCRTRTCDIHDVNVALYQLS
jgi:haloalkane dehalogenase